MGPGEAGAQIPLAGCNSRSMPPCMLLHGGSCIAVVDVNHGVCGDMKSLVRAIARSRGKRQDGRTSIILSPVHFPSTISACMTMPIDGQECARKSCGFPGTTGLKSGNTCPPAMTAWMADVRLSESGIA